ncbi:MAG: AAA family ATPase [Legionellales bacterium]|nr:AAA family ATPase [Legionellales bacterium]|tara:strand:- start:45762 stop:47219 length:1458 start_codon:yes stop_codon:yes gene_type:complete
MNIIGRKKEVEQLQQLYESDSAEFLALYGRRRVGKTYLIWQYFQNKKGCLFFDVTGLKDGNMATQIANVMDRIGKIFYNGLKLQHEKNWRDVFERINDAIENQTSVERIVMFFDELPWMATPRSKLLETLDYYWNQYWSRNPKIKLIICGSSASWIINKIINSKGGLHNRVTEQMLLKPYDLSNTKKFLQARDLNLSDKQILLLYMVTGGIPFYLAKIKWKTSAMQIIQKLCFSEDAFFLGEFDNLFSSLFKDHGDHIKIVKILAQNRYGIMKNKLLKQIGATGGNSAKRLNELEDAGFIMSFKPLYHRRRGIYYRLVDEYTYFYLRWIEPIKSKLQAGAFDKNDWQAVQLTPEWHSWLGYAFESVCYKHIAQIKQKLDLPPMSLASTWNYSPQQSSNTQGAQIDLLFDRRDDAITVCEIKYSDKPYTITKSYADVLNQKLTVFKEQTRSKKQLLIAFIAAEGLTNNQYKQTLVSSIVTLEDLFE